MNGTCQNHERDLWTSHRGDQPQGDLPLGDFRCVELLSVLAPSFGTGFRLRYRTDFYRPLGPSNLRRMESSSVVAFEIVRHKTNLLSCASSESNR